MDDYAKDYLTVWAIESPKAVDKGWNAGSCCGLASETLLNINDV
jgi:hypothetical protein